MEEVYGHYYHVRNQSENKIQKLISSLTIMMKNTLLDEELGETLDSFMTELNDNQEFLSHGICNMNFSQAALFVQQSVEVYSKKVDILWHNALEYQMKLCSASKQTEETSREISRIESRLIKKRGKRNTKKEMPTLGNLPDFRVLPLNKIDSILKQTTTTAYSENLKNYQNIVANAIEPFNAVDRSHQGENNITHSISPQSPAASLVLKFQPPCLYGIYDSCTQEKVCNYQELLSNKVLSMVTLPPSGVQITIAPDQNKESQTREHSTTSDEMPNLCLIKQAAEDDGSGQSQDINSDILQIFDSPKLDLENGNADTLFPKPNLDVTEDHGYSSAPASHGSSDLPLSLRKSNDDSGFFYDPFGNIIMEVDENCNIPGTTGTLEKSGNSTTLPNTPQDTTLPNVDTSVPLQSSHRADSHFSELFLPITSSTPKKDPYVKLIPLSRKRVLQLENGDKSKLKAKRVARSKVPKNIVVFARRFEKFHNTHYIPSVGEGQLIPWLDSDSSSDEDANVAEQMEIEPNHEDEGQKELANACFANTLCKGIVLEMIDHVVREVTNSKTLDALPELTVPNLTNISPITQESGGPSSSPVVNPTLSFFQKIDAMTEWRNFIQPKLHEAECAPKYNIHEYGTEVMDAIPQDKNLLFADLVSGRSPAVVARYFMATLQLANTYNVELLNTCPGQLANDTLELKLLSKDRYHEHLVAYEPPSENSLKEKFARMRASQHQASNSKVSSAPRKEHQKLLSTSNQPPISQNHSSTFQKLQSSRRAPPQYKTQPSIYQNPYPEEMPSTFERMPETSLELYQTLRRRSRSLSQSPVSLSSVLADYDRPSTSRGDSTVYNEPTTSGNCGFDNYNEPSTSHDSHSVHSNQVSNTSFASVQSPNVLNYFSKPEVLPLKSTRKRQKMV